MLPWTEDEDEFIIEEWMAYDNFPGERDEETVSKILERTIEACRNRAEILRRNHGIETPNVVPIRTGKNRPYIGAHDEDGDRWWES